MAGSDRRAPIVVVGALMFVAVACSSGSAEQGRATTTVAPTTTTIPPLAPLTGVPQPDPAKLARPAVVVKIDNSPQARPQAGLGAADLVYEEITEGITRFIVVFHSTDADPVGPVRSVRPADPLVVLPLGGLLGFSGGTPPIVALVRSAGVTFIDENSTDTLYRRSGRPSPHNLYTDTDKLVAKAGDLPAPPFFGAFVQPGGTYDPPGAVPVESIDVPLAKLLASYEWDEEAEGWARSTNGEAHMLESGDQWTPDNLILQFVDYSRFAHDAAVTYPEVLSSGEAWFLSQGTLAKGTWSKDAPDSVTEFSDAEGNPMALSPGHTVIELVSNGAQVDFEGPPEPSTTVEGDTGGDSDGDSDGTTTTAG